MKTFENKSEKDLKINKNAWLLVFYDMMSGTSKNKNSLPEKDK